ncbi:hypothetical protein [Streptosporangium sp. LJ11]|uniref:hypothetical protein n=1 Tax=Streptosporangium sp. LJ11 TaxID=3436927 RepID=UPI003F791EC0
MGIQNHGAGDDMSFRNIRIEELGATGGDTTVQAENRSETNGVQTYPRTPTHGGTVLGYVTPAAGPHRLARRPAARSSTEAAGQAGSANRPRSRMSRR